MGLFDFIGKTMQESEEAAMEAEAWDVERICVQMERAFKDNKKMRAAGYGKTLRMKANSMSNSELEDLWDYIYHKKNAVARSIVAPVMQDRGLIER